MEKAAVEGFKPKDSEGATRKSRIRVEGYDTSLPYDDVKSALRRRFSSCGEIMDICIPRYVEPDALNIYALVTLLGEDAVEKALKLHGSDVGGWKVLVRDYPIPGELTPEMAAKIAIKNSYPTYVAFSGYWMTVSGYNTSLPEDDIKRGMKSLELEDRESSEDDASSRFTRSFITFLGGRGRDTEKKALERNGSDMKGWNIVVTPFPYPKPISELDAYREASKPCVKVQEDEREGGWIIVYAYGNDEDIKKSLIKHFSSCGEITRAYVVRGRRVNRVKVLIKGEGAVEKALKLTECECGVKGCKLVAKK
ncbi:unnamed protein product [Arabis nemorensis]|uniref:RRM domain-containing protein n=1 Tax=Arabis nemorensis TaxID=586526 RepID=A0A565CK58_9BRAS|nr:unnamed protein product [Arabis nemorensis]